MDREGWSISFCEAAVDDLVHRSIRNAELLIVLGGPIGVYETDAAWSFVEQPVVDRFEGELARDLESGRWDKQHGKLRTKPFFEGSLKLSSAALDFSAPSYFGACSVTP